MSRGSRGAEAPLLHHIRPRWGFVGAAESAVAPRPLTELADLVDNDLVDLLIRVHGPATTAATLVADARDVIAQAHRIDRSRATHKELVGVAGARVPGGDRVLAGRSEQSTRSGEPTDLGIHVPYKQPGDGNVLAVDHLAFNALQRGLRALGERGFALLTGRWRALQRITASPSRIGDITAAARMLTEYEHGDLHRSC